MCWQPLASNLQQRKQMSDTNENQQHPSSGLPSTTCSPYLPDALAWAESDGTDHVLAWRLEKVGKWGSAGDNALVIVAKEYRKMERDRNKWKDLHYVANLNFKIADDARMRMEEDLNELLDAVRHMMEAKGGANVESASKRLFSLLENNQREARADNAAPPKPPTQ